jgi:hypothetical protein
LLRDHTYSIGAYRPRALRKSSAATFHRSGALAVGWGRILDPEKIVETKDAYDETKLNALDERDVRDAIEFDTETKEMFGLAWIDDEVRMPLHDALS